MERNGCEHEYLHFCDQALMLLGYVRTQPNAKQVAFATFFAFLASQVLPPKICLAKHPSKCTVQGCVTVKAEIQNPVFFKVAVERVLVGWIH